MEMSLGCEEASGLKPQDGGGPHGLAGVAVCVSGCVRTAAPFHYRLGEPRPQPAQYPSARTIRVLLPSRLQMRHRPCLTRFLSPSSHGPT